MKIGSGRGIKTAPATENGITVTLPLAALTPATHYPDGYLPALMFFADDPANPGYVKLADDTVAAGERVYCLVSNTQVPTNGTTVGLGVWHTGVGLYRSALPFPVGPVDEAAAKDQGITLWDC